MEVTKLQSHVDEIMDNFDFRKVQETMTLLDWKIFTEDNGYCVPEEYELRALARQRIYHLIDEIERLDEDYYYSHSGPFKVRMWRENGVIYRIELDFVVTEWEIIDYEYINSSEENVRSC